MKSIVGVCYRPPNLKDEEETDLLSQEMAVKQGNVIILGDFNYPDIDWIDETAYSSRTHYFVNVLEDNFMCQFTYTPTRNKALIDLLITNNTELIGDVEVRDNLQNIDHGAIMFAVNHRKRRQEGKTRTLHFK